MLDGPSREHPLGTDSLGRDVLARMLYGSRVSLAVGFVSVGIATLVGVLLAPRPATTGPPGRADHAAGGPDAGVPRFFLLLAVLAFLRPSIWTIMAVIGLTGWMGVARLVRAEFLTLREREFVVWSQSIGASGFRIIWRHILPNAMAPVLVAMTLGIPAAILTESGLSFLGLGVQPPYATWGNILNEGKDAIELAWWLSLYPGLAILITVLSYNLLGEGSATPRPAPPPGDRQVCASASVMAYSETAPKWRNWQTRTFEGRVGQPVGFESPFGTNRNPPEKSPDSLENGEQIANEPDLSRSFSSLCPIKEPGRSLSLARRLHQGVGEEGGRRE